MQTNRSTMSFISARPARVSNWSVFFSMAFRSSEYLVSRCIGFTSKSVNRNRPHSFCDSHHCGDVVVSDILIWGTSKNGKQNISYELFFSHYFTLRDIADFSNLRKTTTDQKLFNVNPLLHHNGHIQRHTRANRSHQVIDSTNCTYWAYLDSRVRLSWIGFVVGNELG